MENQDWKNIAGKTPYIASLLIRSDASYATQYYNPKSLHPSEPNYIWMEAGTNKFADHTFVDDNDASSSNSTNSSDHLVRKLSDKGIPWKAYQEDISGNVCPLVSNGNYAAKHNPVVFFKDVTEGNNPQSQNCI